jgi:hypothetical protein
MKRNTMLVAAIIVFFVMSINSMATAGVKPRAAGIGLRGTYWHMNNSNHEIYVSNSIEGTEVDVGGGGGWIYFFSRIDNSSLLEFSLGAVGRAETKTNYIDGEEVDVDAILAVLMGLRHELFSVYNPSALRPYLSLGVGPYWLNDVTVRERYWGYEEEVKVKAKVKPGGYAGVGTNFMLSSSFGLTFDARYHFVNFNVNHEYSGWEYGMGIVIAWGRYIPER